MGIHLWAFVGISSIVIVLPGPDTLLVTKNSMLHGRAVGLATALGVGSGLLVWTIAAAAGVAAIVHSSAVAFTILKLSGALYLIWLGVRSLHSSGPPRASEQAGGRQAQGAQSGFRQGLMSNLANPKIAVFFTSLLPQFVSSHEPTLLAYLLLGGTFVLMTLGWLCGCALATARASSALTGSRAAALLRRLAGVLLVGLGIRLAFDRR